MMTDPIADMLTRIRNAVAIERPTVDIPASHEKVGIAQVLQREGYIWDFEVVDEKPVKILRVNLKYGPNGERIIQENLGRICKGRTVFIIAHRLSTIRHADTILVLEKGQLVEQGNHIELISRGGIYQHLFSQQAGGPTHAAA